MEILLLEQKGINNCILPAEQYQANSLFTLPCPLAVYRVFSNILIASL